MISPVISWGIYPRIPEETPLGRNPYTSFTENHSRYSQGNPARSFKKNFSMRATGNFFRSFTVTPRTPQEVPPGIPTEFYPFFPEVLLQAPSKVKQGILPGIPQGISPAI